MKNTPRFVSLMFFALASLIYAQAPIATKTPPTPVVETELNRHGFYPDRITIPAGKVRIQIRNRSGFGPHSLVFTNTLSEGALPGNVSVAPIPITLGVPGSPNVHWKQDLNLPKGTYVITAPLTGKLDRKFTVTVN